MRYIFSKTSRGMAMLALVSFRLKWLVSGAILSPSDVSDGVIVCYTCVLQGGDGRLRSQNRKRRDSSQMIIDDNLREDRSGPKFISHRQGREIWGIPFAARTLPSTSYLIFLESQIRGNWHGFPAVGSSPDFWDSLGTYNQYGTYLPDYFSNCAFPSSCA